MNEVCPTFKPGQEVLATFDFQGKTSHDLSFKKGDILTVVNVTSDPNYLLAKKHGVRNPGVIPVSYVIKRASSNSSNVDSSTGHRHHNNNNQRELTLQQKSTPWSWFHGRISRENSEQLLFSSPPVEDGVFLVRDSTNFPGDFTLSVLCNSKVEHYRIIVGNDKKFTIDEESWFDSLVALIDHYLKDADGLCCTLIRGVKRKSSLNTSSSNNNNNDSNNNNGITTKISPTSDRKKAVVDELPPHNWLINMDDVQLFELIGQGEFAGVKRGTYLGNAVAVKTVKDPLAAQQLLAEAKIMIGLKHPNLVQLIGYGYRDSTTYIVTEYLSKGNLVDYLRSRGRQAISRRDQLNFAYDICSAMTYLESRRIVHRDLAARNVLLADDLTAKVSDFGLASAMGAISNGGAGSMKFPIKWTAPECLEEPNRFGSKSDVWSFGVLLWEIYSFGRVPYPRIPLDDVVRFVSDGYRMEAPESCPADSYELMKACWRRNPDERPSFSDILKKLDSQRAVLV